MTATEAAQEIVFFDLLMDASEHLAVAKRLQEQDLLDSIAYRKALVSARAKIDMSNRIFQQLANIISD